MARYLPALLFALHATAYTPLSDSTLNNLPSVGDDFNVNTGKLLSPILIPRVSGTEGNRRVQEFFVDFFRTQLPEWQITLQNSTQTPPAPFDHPTPFTNIIATRDPPWTQPGDVGRLALVAHYDSKATPEGFIGAIDSAAPCAMLLHAARSIDAALTQKWSSMQDMDAMRLAEGDLEERDEQGIQILLLDGEESFVSWTATDSTYGARSLAAEWESTYHVASSTYSDYLSNIRLFCLLDLLGAEYAGIPSYYRTTDWAYQHMASIEKRMRDQGLMTSKGTFLKDGGATPTRWLGGAIDDDHRPFHERGVDILHLIPMPFPRVWHEMTDDGDHLDGPTVVDWAQLTAAFAAEWMDLEGFFPVVNPRERDELNPVR